MNGLLISPIPLLKEAKLSHFTQQLYIYTITVDRISVH